MLNPRTSIIIFDIFKFRLNEIIMTPSKTECWIKLTLTIHIHIENP